MANLEYEPMPDGSENTMLPSTEAKLRGMFRYYENRKLSFVDVSDARFLLGKIKERDAEIERLKKLCPAPPSS
jgi:hypothetical protein